MRVRVSASFLSLASISIRPPSSDQDEMVRGSSLVESHRFGATCVHGRMRGMRMLRRNGRRAHEDRHCENELFHSPYCRRGRPPASVSKLTPGRGRPRVVWKVKNPEECYGNWVLRSAFAAAPLRRDNLRRCLRLACGLPTVARRRRAKVGGEGGIRTPVPVTRQDAFEAPPLRPLRYLSIITTLGAKPLAARSRSPSATAFQRSLAAAGAYYFARGKAPRCALAVAFGDCLQPRAVVSASLAAALACGRRRCLQRSLRAQRYHFAAASLRARGRLRRLPSNLRAIVTRRLPAVALAKAGRLPSALRLASRRSLAAAGALFLRAVATTYPSRRDLKKS